MKTGSDVQPKKDIEPEKFNGELRAVFNKIAKRDNDDYLPEAKSAEMETLELLKNKAYQVTTPSNFVATRQLQIHLRQYLTNLRIRRNMPVAITNHIAAIEALVNSIDSEKLTYKDILDKLADTLTDEFMQNAIKNDNLGDVLGLIRYVEMSTPKGKEPEVKEPEEDDEPEDEPEKDPEPDKPKSDDAIVGNRWLKTAVKEKIISNSASKNTPNFNSLVESINNKINRLSDPGQIKEGKYNKKKRFLGPIAYNNNLAFIDTFINKGLNTKKTDNTLVVTVSKNASSKTEATVLTVKGTNTILVEPDAIRTTLPTEIGKNHVADLGALVPEAVNLMADELSNTEFNVAIANVQMIQRTTGAEISYTKDILREKLIDLAVNVLFSRYHTLPNFSPEGLKAINWYATNGASPEHKIKAKKILKILEKVPKLPVANSDELKAAIGVFRDEFLTGEYKELDKGKNLSHLTSGGSLPTTPPRSTVTPPVKLTPGVMAKPMTKPAAPSSTVTPKTPSTTGTPTTAKSTTHSSTVTPKAPGTTATSTTVKSTTRSSRVTPKTTGTTVTPTPTTVKSTTSSSTITSTDPKKVVSSVSAPITTAATMSHKKATSEATIDSIKTKITELISDDTKPKLEPYESAMWARHIGGGSASADEKALNLKFKEKFPPVPRIEPKGKGI